MTRDVTAGTLPLWEPPPTPPSLMACRRRPPLPSLVEEKLTKTRKTRGASPTSIYQNRVVRNGTVLIPFSHWFACPPPAGETYERGAIALIDAGDYFRDPDALARAGLTLGVDALVFYSQRADWLNHPPSARDWRTATSRTAPLGGQYVARVSGTRSSDDSIQEGFTSSNSRGAGIRVYEYASKATIERTRLQLEALLWHCYDTQETFERQGVTAQQFAERAAWRRSAEEDSSNSDLLDLGKLRAIRALDTDGHTICPLCLEKMSARHFTEKVQQAAGRERFDARLTEASLFHIAELRVGEFGHRPYNLGWGHHRCNVTAGDVGIQQTLQWMREVIARNDLAGP